MKYIIFILIIITGYFAFSQEMIIKTSEREDRYDLPAVKIEIAVSSTAWCVDDDGNAYRTVKIGSQTWMAENLKVGTMIPGIQEMANNNKIEKYCYNDILKNCDLYGGLYQWHEMLKYTIVPKTRGICPKGWHLPEDSEWKILEMAVGMSKEESDGTEYRGTNQGDKLRIKGSSGFDAILGGGRDVGGMFIYLGYHGYYWTASENILTHAWGRYFVDGFQTVYRSRDHREHGFSVRCVKD